MPESYILKQKIEQFFIVWPETIGYTLTQNRMAWLHRPWGATAGLTGGYSRRRHGWSRATHGHRAQQGGQTAPTLTIPSSSNFEMWAGEGEISVEESQTEFSSISEALIRELLGRSAGIRHSN